MKTRLWIGLAAVVTLAGLPARGGELAEKVSPAVIMEELSTRLSLTPEQQALIGPLLEERNRSIQTLVEGLDATSSRREQLQALRQARSIQEEFVSQVTPALTPEQAAEWKKLREEAQDKLEQAWKSRR